MIPYRTRNLLRKLVVTGLLLLLIVAAGLLCWFLWLNRFVIYTRVGAMLDFDLPPEFSVGQQAQAQEPKETIDIYYNEGDNAILPGTTELTQLSGVCITGQMLTENFETVKKYVSTLPAEIPVLLDVKNIRGEFYYTTTLGKQSKQIEPQQMDALIASLQQTGRYLIARLPAFRDYWFGLENVNCGIFNPNRLSLWMDEERCYWLNPKSEGTLTYLIQIVTELREMGFDEVVFTDFQVPATNAIYFEGDRAQAINETAATLVKTCAKDTFAVSFVRSIDTFQLPEGRSRLYLMNVAAADAAAAAAQTGLEDIETRLVFLTELMDTRFDDYGVLRPAQIAQ